MHTREGQSQHSPAVHEKRSVTQALRPDIGHHLSQAVGVQRDPMVRPSQELVLLQLRADKVKGKTAKGKRSGYFHIMRSRIHMVCASLGDGFVLRNMRKYMF